MGLQELKARAQSTIDAVVNNKIEDFGAVAETLSEIPMRDFTLRFMYDNPELRPALIEGLGNVIINTKTETPALYTLCAGAYWLDGDQEHTRENLNKALNADSGYSLARLLDVALNNGVPVSVWADSLKDVTPDQCLTGAV